MSKINIIFFFKKKKWQDQSNKRSLKEKLSPFINRRNHQCCTSNQMKGLGAKNCAFSFHFLIHGYIHTLVLHIYNMNKRDQNSQSQVQPYPFCWMIKPYSTTIEKVSHHQITPQETVCNPITALKLLELETMGLLRFRAFILPAT